MRRYVAAILLALFAPFAARAQTISGEINGTFADEAFGQAVACRGQRLLVGAPRTINAPHDGGSASLIFPPGSASAKLIAPPFTAVGFEQFGAAVAIVDDFSGDGVPDYLIGAPGVLGSGFVYLYADPGAGNFGGPAGSVGGLTADNFGASLAALGDINGDGVAEFLVGAPNRNDGFGAAVVVDLVKQQKLGAFSGGIEALGTAVAGLGDLNGDARPDGIAGSPRFRNTSTDIVGRVVIFDAVSFTAINSIVGSVIDSNFGAALADAGDLNGDGVPELLVGAPAAPNSAGGPPGMGAAYLYSGATLGVSSPKPLCVLGGGASPAKFGASVAGLGDVDGDGHKDFAVGAPDTNGDSGKLSIYSFQPDGSCPLETSFDGAAAGYQLPASIAGGTSRRCDFNNDGAPDFAAGTGSDTAGADAGSVVVYSGIPAPMFPATADLRYRIDAMGNFSGQVEYDLDPRSLCTFEIRGIITTGNRMTPVKVLGSFTAVQPVVPLAAASLPEVRKNNHHKPIIHLIVRTTCAGTTFNSNVFSRYLNCGVEPPVSPQAWFTAFESGVSANAAAVRVRRHFRRR